MGLAEHALLELPLADGTLDQDNLLYGLLIPVEFVLAEPILAVLLLDRCGEISLPQADNWLLVLVERYLFDLLLCLHLAGGCSCRSGA